MQYQVDKAFHGEGSKKALLEAFAGGACGLLLAALLVFALTFVLTGGAFGQDGPGQESARYECEAGARSVTMMGRALGACDLLLRDTSLDHEDRARVLTNRAVMLLARGMNTQARQDLEEATELSPELAQAWLNLSAAQISTGSARQALSTAARARDLGADPALVDFNIGIAFETLGQFEDAYAAYGAAAAQDPDNATLAAQPRRFVWHQG